MAFSLSSERKEELRREMGELTQRLHVLEMQYQNRKKDWQGTDAETTEMAQMIASILDKNPAVRYQVHNAIPTLGLGRETREIIAAQRELRVDVARVNSLMAGEMESVVEACEESIAEYKRSADTSRKELKALEKQYEEQEHRISLIRSVPQEAIQEDVPKKQDWFVMVDGKPVFIGFNPSQFGRVPPQLLKILKDVEFPEGFDTKAFSIALFEAGKAAENNMKKLGLERTWQAVFERAHSLKDEVCFLTKVETLIEGECGPGRAGCAVHSQKEGFCVSLSIDPSNRKWTVTERK